MASSGAKLVAGVGTLIVVAAVFVGIHLWTSGGSPLAQVGGPFTLIDQDGKTRSDTDFRGQFMLVYFGYTFCPDVCPTEVNQMSLAIDALGDKAGKVRPVFITIDPARDTPAKLKEYAQNFHPRLVALTGDAKAIAATAKSYRVYYARAKGADEKNYLMDHSSIIYLMDADGRYVTHFTVGMEVERMAARIREHLS